MSAEAGSFFFFLGFTMAVIVTFYDCSFWFFFGCSDVMGLLKGKAGIMWSLDILAVNKKIITINNNKLLPQ